MKVKWVVACFETQTEEFQNYVGGAEEPLTKQINFWESYFEAVEK